MMHPLRTDIVGRRAFVGRCTAVAGLWALGGCASLMTRTVTPVDGQIELDLMHYPELTEPGRWLKLLPDGYKEPIYVLTLRDGSINALSPICTHLGCTVEVMDERLVCPCHGSTYDRSGAVLLGPAQQPLARYPVSMLQGVITIDLRVRT